MKDAKVLMVGAGGIGCELLKTLALSGFNDIHIIDMDTIEVSNLNRQFLFRQSHVGQSKAKVARDAVLKFKPHISITPYHANVKDSEFNVDFFKQFGVVLNGLDNLDARRHVNRLCLAADVPLVESGTAGFLGQVTVHIKGKTECYECHPKNPPKTTYPVCTISSTPSQFVHCIVWAKDLLFAKLFGDKSQENDLIVRSGEGLDVFLRREDEDIEDYGKRIYDHVFGYNIEMCLTNEEAWKNRNKPCPIYFRDVLPDTMSQSNGNVYRNNRAKDASSLSAMSSLGLKNFQDIWSLKENSRVFLEAIKLCFTHRAQDVGKLSFDKDDQLAMEFVTAAANIRATCFGIPLRSLFEAKGIAGNIVHAVATTNAIIAGLIVIEAIKVLQNDADNYRMTFCNEYERKQMLLYPIQPDTPEPACFVCSDSQTPLLTLEINTRRTLLRDFVDKIVNVKLGMNLPLIMRGTALLYEVGDDLDEDSAKNYANNLQKVFSELLVTNGMLLAVEDLQQEFTCNIQIVHREEFDDEKEPDGMVLSGTTLVKNEDKNTNGNDGSSTNTSLVEFEKVGDIEISERLQIAKKRQLPEIEDLGGDDELIMLDNWKLTNRRTRLQ